MSQTLCKMLYKHHLSPPSPPHSPPRLTLLQSQWPPPWSLNTYAPAQGLCTCCSHRLELFPQISKWLPPTFFKSLLKCPFPQTTLLKVYSEFIYLPHQHPHVLFYFCFLISCLIHPTECSATQRQAFCLLFAVPGLFVGAQYLALILRTPEPFAHIRSVVLTATHLADEDTEAERSHCRKSHRGRTCLPPCC